MKENLFPKPLFEVVDAFATYNDFLFTWRRKIEFEAIAKVGMNFPNRGEGYNK